MNPEIKIMVGRISLISRSRKPCRIVFYKGIIWSFYRVIFILKFYVLKKSDINQIHHFCRNQSIFTVQKLECGQIDRRTEDTKIFECVGKELKIYFLICFIIACIRKFVCLTVSLKIYYYKRIFSFYKSILRNIKVDILCELIILV